jgi:hypothetical protein
VVTSSPRSRQVHQQAGDQGGVLGVALDDSQGVLGPLDVDAQCHYAGMTCEMDPVDHERHQVDAGQVDAHEVIESDLGGRHEAPGDR